MTKKIHIIILIDQLHEKGGIERLVALKANYWSSVFKYDVSIISTEQLGKRYAFDLDPAVKFIDLGINYNRSISYFHPKNLWKFVKNMLAIKKLIRELQPSHILVASHIPITYSINFIKGNAKTIKEYHYTKYDETIANKKAQLELKLENKYDFNVVLSQEELQYHHTRNKIVIPNPIEVAPETELPEAYKESKRMLFLGRIAPVKNLRVLVNIWAAFVKKGYTDWHLDIVGDYNNSYGAALAQEISKLKISENVHLKGNIHHPQTIIPQYYAMLLSSLQECFPMVILEAFAKGVPVVSFDSPTGPRNMIQNKENGLLVSYNNEADFVAALEWLVKHPEDRAKMSQNAFASAQTYSIDKVMLQWKKLIFEA